MCSATGTPASCARAQNGSSSPVGSTRAVREDRDQDAAIALPQRPFELGRPRRRRRSRESRRGRTGARRRGAELEQPLVVRAHAGELQRALVAEHARALLAHARIEHLRVDAVGVHVGEPRRDLVVCRGGCRRTSSRTDGSRGSSRRPPPSGRRAHALAVVEGPDVAVARCASPSARARAARRGRAPARAAAARRRARRRR